jgi:hypothetical protein
MVVAITTPNIEHRAMPLSGNLNAGITIGAPAFAKATARQASRMGNAELRSLNPEL